jgi:hypothetical protein
VDPQDFFGPPLERAVCDAGMISVPMGGSFRAFVVFKDGDAAPEPEGGR